MVDASHLGGWTIPPQEQEVNRSIFIVSGLIAGMQADV